MEPAEVKEYKKLEKNIQVQAVIVVELLDNNKMSISPDKTKLLKVIPKFRRRTEAKIKVKIKDIKYLSPQTQRST